MLFDSLDHLGVDQVDEMTFLSRKYLACSLCDLHGAVEYAGATTARCSGDQVAAVGRGRATGVVVDPPVQVEDDVVAEAWRRDEEAATSQCSGWHWWQLPVAVSPSLSIGLGLGRWGTVTADEPGNPTPLIPTSTL